VRAALMNMGNPVFQAYSMERVAEKERATFSSMSSSTWSLGWAAGSWLSGTLRDAIGFTAGFNILFGLMAALYAASMVITWVWFVGQESRQMAEEKARNAARPTPAAA
jgi:predicted MFS family arabinose efflux permease